MDSQGKVIMESILETKASTLLEFLAGLHGSLFVTFEEGSVLVRAVLSGTLALAGRQDDARTVLSELEQSSAEKYVSPIPVALTLAALGEHEAAFTRLEEGIRLHCPRAIWGKVDPRLDVLRSDSRYAAMLRKIGLPQ